MKIYSFLMFLYKNEKNCFQKISSNYSLCLIGSTLKQSLLRGTGLPRYLLIVHYLPLVPVGRLLRGTKLESPSKEKAYNASRRLFSDGATQDSNLLPSLLTIFRSQDFTHFPTTY